MPEGNALTPEITGFQDSPMNQLIRLSEQYGGVKNIPPDELEELGYKLVDDGAGSLRAVKQRLPEAITTSVAQRPEETGLVPEQREKSTPPKSLKFPEDAEKIGKLLEKIKIEKDILWRTISRVGGLKFDATGRPKLAKSHLPSEGYEAGGWQGVAKTFQLYAQNELNITVLINNTDGAGRGEKSEQTLCPFAYTSPNPKGGLMIKPVESYQDDVVVIIRPDLSRVRADDLKDNEINKISIAAKKKQPFRIDLISSLPTGYDGLEETLLGPYIMRKEIVALISVPREQHDQFVNFVSEKMRNI